MTNKQTNTLVNFEQRRTKFLERLLLTLIALTSVTLLSLMLPNIRNDQNFTGRTLAYVSLIGGLTVILVLAYVASRRNHYWIAAILTLLCAILGPWGALAFDQTIPDGNVLPLTYTVLAVILSSILLPVTATIVISLMQFLFLTLFPIYFSFSTNESWISFLAFYLFITVLSLMANMLSQKDMRQIDEQIATISESEARWQFALEGAGDGVWDWNVTTNRVFYSRQWKAILGYTEHEVEDSFDEWDKRLHPDDKPQCYAGLERHFAGEIAIFQNEHRLLCKDGTYKWVLSRGKVIEWIADGKPQRFISVDTDISKRKEYEAQLQQAKKTAEDADQAKSIFLANMSHELRTPLNAVLGFTQLMANAPNLTAEQRQNLGIVSRSGEHLLALINDVLEISKIEAGRIELHTEDFDLHYLLQGLIEMFQLRAEQKGLTLTCELDAVVPQRIHADEGKLRQVLINLLGNAVKFTHMGTITLRVMGKERGVTGEMSPPSPLTPYLMLHFAVEDTGAGIAPEEQAAIFDAFAQTESGRQSGEGTGLGLPISRQYVRLMGGELRVSSAAGQGSCFTFDLPVAVPERADKSSPDALHAIVGLAPGQTAPDGGPYRLLVVEDVPASRKLLVDLLRSWQPEGEAVIAVREAANGQVAVSLWEQWRPHLIWMDIRMPVMDGYEATRQIRAHAQAGEMPTAVIVALTASAFDEERSRILAEGCDDFVRKPFQQAEISAALSHRLGLRFVYADSETTIPHAPFATPDLAADLRRQPPEWQTDVRQAVLEGDLEWLLALIEQIQPTAPALAQQLTALADNFEHTKILEML
ncbi:MAG: ATP-binding protein [Anaerolineales bacterium]